MEKRIPQKKYCPSCHTIKPVKEFRKLWCGLYANTCKQCEARLD